MGNLSEIRPNSSQGPDEGLSARVCMYMCRLRVDGDAESGVEGALMASVSVAGD